ncbi:MAG TPA: hypothetical protein VNK52_11085 [Hyphomicrobiaceae bacterium]|nr:hypothetical protein [Hyphomicrobiaceae bacterium]
MMDMGPMSLWHLVILAAVAFLWIFPMWRIIDRMGRPPALALLMVFPPAFLIVLWWLAYTDWPAAESSAPRRG